MYEIDYLASLVSRGTLNTMSGKQKLAYKYCLCAIFINIIKGAHYTNVQEMNILKADEVRKLRRKSTNFNSLVDDISKLVKLSLEKNCFNKPYDEKLINDIITFLRRRVQELQQGEVSLFQAKEISKFLDIKNFFNPNISEHHWIQFDLSRHLIITVPEMIIFNDLKVQWNFFIELREELSKGLRGISSREDMFEFYKKEQTREVHYRLSAVFRTLIILCVSFTEAYLYNIFYCIKESNLSNKDIVYEILQLKKIEDLQIIKQIIYPLFPHIKENIGYLVDDYKKIIKYRDRYIHASPFIDPSDNKSELQPLLIISEMHLIHSLQTSVDFVTKLDELLPQGLKILFWWYDGDIKFNEFKKLKLTNEESQINKIKYYNL